MPTSVYPFAKVELRGPRPFGGTYFSTLTDPAIDRLIVAGWRIARTWTVTGPRTSEPC